MRNLTKIRNGALWVVSVLFVTLSQAPASHAMKLEKSDLWIKIALEFDMEKDGHLDMNRIGVSSHNGIVKLKGTVLTAEEKGLTELLAMQIPGVRGVENDIRVIPPLDQDFAIEKQARAALIENPLLDIKQLRVHVVNGNVTLQGIVDRTHERQLADRLVSMLPDVHKVIDRMETLRRT